MNLTDITILLVRPLHVRPCSHSPGEYGVGQTLHLFHCDRKAWICAHLWCKMVSLAYDFDHTKSLWKSHVVGYTFYLPTTLCLTFAPQMIYLPQLFPCGIYILYPVDLYSTEPTTWQHFVLLFRCIWYIYPIFFPVEYTHYILRPILHWCYNIIAYQMNSLD